MSPGAPYASNRSDESQTNTRGPGAGSSKLPTIERDRGRKPRLVPGCPTTSIAVELHCSDLDHPGGAIA